MTDNKADFTFFSMIKEGNLLRADRPLEPDRRPPFVPWGSNLIPSYLSTCAQSRPSEGGNLVRSQKRSVVDQAENSNAKFIEKAPTSEPNQLEVTSDISSGEIMPNEPDKVSEMIDSALLAELTDFNSCWILWKGFIKTLKRKLLENPGDISGKLASFEDLFYCKALLYTLTMEEQAQKEIRRLCAAKFSQFVNHNKSLFDAFSSSSMLNRKQAYQFILNVLVCLCVYEVLETHSNVLKLEGSAAAGICPDKKEFIFKHVQQNWGELFSDSDDQIKDFINFLPKEIPLDLIESVKFNREQLLVKLNFKLHSHENRFIIQGSTDRLDDLQVSKLN